jgi:hypothetical protein
MAKDILLYTLSAIFPLIIGGGVWLVKIYLPKRIEAQVKHQYDLKLEEFKALAAEKTMRSSRVYEQIAVTIQEFYNKLYQYHAALLKILDDKHTQPTLEEAVADFRRQGIEFFAYYSFHGVYFPPHCEPLVNEVIRLLNTFDYVLNLKLKARDASPQIAARFKQEITTVMIDFGKKFGDANRRLRPEFQKFLGIIPEKV